MTVVTEGTGYWSIVDYPSGDIVVYSDQQILDEYGDHWRKQMKKAGKDPDAYGPSAIIEDWVAVHWAVPAEAPHEASE
jgi:predicted nucleic acid-binding protein